MMSKQGKKLKRNHIVIKGAAKNKTSSRPDRTSSPTCVAFIESSSTGQDDEEMGGMGGADDATENEDGVSLGEAVGKIAGGVYRVRCHLSCHHDPGVLQPARREDDHDSHGHALLRRRFRAKAEAIL